jgi:hypothetical protein
MSKDYREYQRTGPGGLGCACCNPYNCHPRNMKHLVRRKARRIEKQKLRSFSD